jgi:hypothetical protein
VRVRWTAAREALSEIESDSDADRARPPADVALSETGIVSADAGARLLAIELRDALVETGSVSVTVRARAAAALEALSETESDSLAVLVDAVPPAARISTARMKYPSVFGAVSWIVTGPGDPDGEVVVCAYPSALLLNVECPLNVIVCPEAGVGVVDESTDTIANTCDPSAVVSSENDTGAFGLGVVNAWPLAPDWDDAAPVNTVAQIIDPVLADELAAADTVSDPGAVPTGAHHHSRSEPAVAL